MLGCYARGSVSFLSFVRRLEVHTGDLSKNTHQIKTGYYEKSVGTPFPPHCTPDDENDYVTPG